MERSGLILQIISTNTSRLKIMSLISAGFSVFVLFTDFLVPGVWKGENLHLYKTLDIILTVISVASILFFFLYKNKNLAIQKTGMVVFPLLFIIWAAVITGIGYGTLGISTLLVVVLMLASFLYMDLVTSISYFVLSGVALLLTLFFMDNLKENYLSLLFLLMPITIISVVISARNYKYKKTEILNQMKLKDINQKLTDNVDNLEKIVQERTKELQLSLERAKESDRLKSAFLANMSHEIRTPMNGIIGFTRLLKEPDLTLEEQQEFIRTIEESGERMLSTLNNIIDLSKIESGVVKIVIKESNINDLIEYSYKFFKPEAEGKGLQIYFRNGLPLKKALIQTDNDIVYKILANLIKNAIKFTQSGSIEFGYVLKTATGNPQLEFFVKDTGPGISEDQGKVIFERFRQGTESLTRNYEGSGLGLSIARSYAEMLDGKIWFESEPGKGSVFFFTIPYITSPGEKDPDKNSKSSTEGEFAAKIGKVLIVEDDETSYLLMRRMLRKICREILHESTGIQAIECCKSNHDLNLVLMDIRLPGIDGYETVSRIRKFNSKIIIIAQTAYGFSGDREKALEAGCNDYISKPIDRALLYELISKHCNL